jgi:hypothetical protein
LAWLQTNIRNSAKFLTGLALLKWELHFVFADWVNPPGARTTNNSTSKKNENFTKIGPNDMPKVAPNYAKDVIKVVQA